MIASGIDRSNAPAIKEITQFDIPKSEVTRLRNGIPVHLIDQGAKDVCRIEMIFKAGSWYEDQPLVARLTGRMLKEGTSSRNAKQIAEEFDMFGTSLRVDTSGDHVYITLRSLNKHVSNILPLLRNVVREASFPENELKTVVENSLQKLKVNLTKNDMVADRELQHDLFGSTHPYGYNSSKEHYEALRVEKLAAFHRQHIVSDKCKIIVSGRIQPETLALLDDLFGDEGWSSQTNAFTPEHLIGEKKELTTVKHLDGSIQAAIRLGKRLFNKKHEDFAALSILNTIFGGYFGSRLMSNIREDKGYTYGIYSGVQSLLNDGYFYVTTEVGVDVADATLKEIYHEINRLQQEQVGGEELELVQNYLRGRWLAAMDGPFKIASLYRGIILYDLEYDYFYNMIETINTISPAQLQDVAQRYLGRDMMHEIVVK